MLMRAVFASAMLIGLAATAQAETKIIYPPHSYQPPMKLCDYVLGDCGDHYDYGHRHHHDDLVADILIRDAAYAKTAKVVVILPPSSGQ